MADVLRLPFFLNRLPTGKRYFDETSPQKTGAFLFGVLVVVPSVHFAQLCSHFLQLMLRGKDVYKRQLRNWNGYLRKNARCGATGKHWGIHPLPAYAYGGHIRPDAGTL